ncbi:MAG: DNA polymerase III subunit gamma/tau [Aggregatilineales bacterium]
MPEQALYLKYRPLRFEDVSGQEHVTRTLRNSLKTGRIRHAYLFSGPRGTGKTTCARLLAKAVNCLHEDAGVHPCNECATCVAVNEGRFLDLIEIDAASHTGVDDVRDLRDKIAFSPGEGKYKVYIIDEVHRFSGNAFDALLKTLEEPPDHALFVLATTEIDKVPATIKSRCLPFEFRRLSMQEVSDRLREITDWEGIQIEQAALELVAREGTGSVRDSISLLDQIVADPEETITLELTQRVLGTASLRAIRDLVTAIINADIAMGLQVINQAVDSGSDPRQFGQQLVEHLRAVLLAQAAGADMLAASEDDRALYAQQGNAIDRSRLLKVIRAFNDAVTQYRGGWQPQLSLELALVESMQQPETQVQTVYVQTPAPAATASQSNMPPPSSSPDTPAVPVKPGTAPIIPAADVQANWQRARGAISHHRPNSILPNLMQHAHVVTVEGNMVTMGVSSQIHLNKLSHQQVLPWIEWALENVHNLKLRVKFVLADGGVVDAIDGLPAELADDPMIEKALELGGQIVEDDEDFSGRE